MENPKFQIFKGKDDQFYFRLRAENGEIILQSEGYTTKASCQNGIDSVKTNGPLDERYECNVSKDGQYFFNLIAANGEVIGVSEMYTEQRNREVGIESVKRNAPLAQIEDPT